MLSLFNPHLSYPIDCWEVHMWNYTNTSHTTTCFRGESDTTNLPHGLICPGPLGSVTVKLLQESLRWGKLSCCFSAFDLGDQINAYADTQKPKKNHYRYIFSSAQLALVPAVFILGPVLYLFCIPIDSILDTHVLLTACKLRTQRFFRDRLPKFPPLGRVTQKRLQKSQLRITQCSDTLWKHYCACFSLT